MTEEKIKEFKERIREVAIEYDVYDLCFAGETEEGNFLGFWAGNDREHINSFMRCVTNSARLYQAGREKMMIAFENISRGK
jgi:hypothetical protein